MGNETVESKPTPPPVRILVVDDEPDLEHLVRQKFRRKIRSKEFNFVFANSGVEAIKKLKDDGEGEIDLVLTDINMPEMDGLTLLGEIGKIDKLLKAVVVSAYGDMENIRTAMNNGAFDFVTKPIDLADLETTINKCVSELRILKQAVKSHDQLVAIQKELNVATEIQTSILPRKFPPFPDRTEFEVFARMIPAREVGGDFYDFFLVDKNRIGFVIGDVSGKGVPAAMLMAVSRTLLKSTAMRGIPTDACMQSINDALAEDTAEDMFVTVFYGVLDTRSGTLEYCSAGHNPPYVLSGDGGVKQLDNIGGLFVGSMPEIEYQSKTVTLQPGETVFIYTDGVTEAESTSEAQFEEERLEASLKGLADASVEKIVARVVDDVKAFASGATQSDDITCLALRYLGPS